MSSHSLARRLSVSTPKSHGPEHGILELADEPLAPPVTDDVVPSRSMTSPNRNSVRRDSIVSALPPHSDFDAEDLCGRYRFRRYLGHGSYGHVCEAVDAHTGERVAIKKVCKFFGNHVDAKRLLRELRILRVFRHENIIELKDILTPRASTVFDSLYIVFEFVDTDLAKLIRSNQYFTELHVQYLLYQILIGAKYISSANVVHRDLKPANILVNEDCTLKICDFGLARGIGPRPSSNSSVSPIVCKSRDLIVNRQLTKHVVTRWYRAPELILLQQEYSTAIDIWSIGCILAELLSMVRENAPGPEHRKPLFPGGSCFPLSADDPMAYTDRLDQLNVIFDVIGTPSAEDIASTKSEKARNYLKLLPECPQQDLSKMFQGSSREAIDLLSRFLQFNPDKRIAVDEALAHKFLANVRDPEVEALVEQPPLVFEFEDVLLTTSGIREFIMMEIRVFNPAFGNSKRIAPDEPDSSAQAVKRLKSSEPDAEAPNLSKQSSDFSQSEDAYSDSISSLL